MLSRPTKLKAAAVVALLLCSFTACHSPRQAADQAQPAPRVKYSPTYDVEIKEIMEVARQNRWEEAQVKADVLVQQDPKSPILTRVQTWVKQQAQLRRAQALGINHRGTEDTERK